MRRWIWLLVLPYVVTVSTEPIKEEAHPVYWDGKPAGFINKADLDAMTPPLPERGEKPE